MSASERLENDESPGAIRGSRRFGRIFVSKGSSAGSLPREPEREAGEPAVGHSLEGIEPVSVGASAVVAAVFSPVTVKAWA